MFAGVETCRVWLRDAATATGGNVVAAVTIRAALGGAKRITWTATGEQLVPLRATTEDEYVDVPVVDQPGWVDGAGNALADWKYVADVRFEGPDGGVLTDRVEFKVLSGQVEIDLSMVLSGHAGAPTIAPLPVVTSVNGMTGAVTVEGLESVDWDTITDKPATFPPASHSHVPADLGTGTPSVSTFLRGDGTWAEPAGGGSGELRGTGSPQGVVTAPPGTYYTDDAGTNGAWRWLKTSGTGTTGWVVVFGDTGWRDITGNLSVAPSSGRLLINRTGDLVTYKAAALMYSANQYIEMTEPPGFVGALFAGGWAGNIGRFLSPDVADAGNGKFSRFATPRIFWTFRAGVVAASDLSIHTINPWPTTTLPGTPA